MSSKIELDVENLSMNFGPVSAVSNVSFSLHPGEIVGLIGPNGAGKSTVVNCLSGALRPTSGRITLGGTQVQRWRTSQIVHQGLARTFQHPRGFGTLSVLDNLRVAALKRDDGDAVAVEAAVQTGLESRLNVRAELLSLSERRRLEIARVLATGATMILLDEVMAGLAETEIEELIPLIETLAADGHGVLLVEHLVWVVSKLSTRLIVLDRGSVLATGQPADVLTNPVVVEAYLGQTIA